MPNASETRRLLLPRGETRACKQRDLTAAETIKLIQYMHEYSGMRLALLGISYTDVKHVLKLNRCFLAGMATFQHTAGERAPGDHHDRDHDGLGRRGGSDEPQLGAERPLERARRPAAPRPGASSVQLYIDS